MIPLLALACTPREGPDDDDVDALFEAEIEAREAFAAGRIALFGRVVDADGAPIAGSRVQVGEDVTTTDARGAWRVDGLHRRNALVQVEAEGYRPHVTSAWLYRPLTLDEVDLGMVALRPQLDGSVRFLFGGDMAFGRRYLDPDEQTPWDTLPPDDPQAVIQTSDPLPGSLAVIDAITPFLDAADVRVGNLESVVTDAPRTPHPTKAFVYFTLPGTLDALTAVGFDYVSLGNNHTYDYLSAGLDDTIAHVAASGLGFSGLGQTPETAWAPYRATWGGQSFSMISATTVDGRAHEIGYVANATQGGAADLTDTERLIATVRAEADAGHVPIAQWHMGNEYTIAPNDYALSRAEEAIDAGAALVVAHHSHVAQGFGAHEGVPIAYCLGNLFFDQDRLETMTGMLLQTELLDGAVVDMEGFPTQLERYLARPISGELADVSLRRWAEFSDTPVHIWGERLRLGAPARVVERDVEVTVDVPISGFAVIDLRSLARPGESLQWARGPVTARPGREIMWMGTMEDVDVDDEQMDVAHWDVTGGSRFPCLSGAYRGALGLCSVRNDQNTANSIIPFRNRVRVWGDATDTPNKDLTLYAMVKGENAGPLKAVVRYYASEGDVTFGEETAFVAAGGTFAWTPLYGDLDMPPDRAGGTRATNPRALRVFLHQYPTRRGEGWLAWDDVSVISWEETLDLGSGATLDTPHARDFLRVQAPAGSYRVDLRFARHERFSAGAAD